MISSHPASRSRRAWRHALGGRQLSLFVALLVILSISFLSLRARPARRTGEFARLSLTTLVHARQVYAAIHGSHQAIPAAELTAHEQALLSDLQKLSELRPDPRTVRQLALMQYTLGDTAWKTSMLRLRALPRRGSAFDAERELALWDTVLDGRPIQEEESDGLRSQIRAMDLGWYEHLAMESIYRHAGMAGAAEAESLAAQQSSTKLLAFWFALEAVALAGMVAGPVMGGYLLWRRRHPSILTNQLLRVFPPRRVTREQADALYAVFLSYLAAYAIIKIALVALRVQTADGFTHPRGPVASLISLVLMLATAVIPLIVFRRLAPRAGLTSTHIGFHSHNIGVDIVWGAVGYAVALPLVYLATAISAWVFRGLDTPLHPALTEFTTTRSFVTQIALLLQAVAVAPVVEETLFRGVFFRTLAPRMGWIAAMVATSAVFAILHPQLPLGFLGIFVLGVVFNLLYALRGSLLPSIVAHCINNATIFVFALLIGD